MLHKNGNTISLAASKVSHLQRIRLDKRANEEWKQWKLFVIVLSQMKKRIEKKRRKISLVREQNAKEIGPKEYILCIVWG